MCQDTDEYKFTIPPPRPPPTPAPTPPPEVPCLVEVDLACTTSDGLDCASIVPPEMQSQETCIENVCYAITIGKKKSEKVAAFMFVDMPF